MKMIPSASPCCTLQTLHPLLRFLNIASTSTTEGATENAARRSPPRHQVMGQLLLMQNFIPMPQICRSDHCLQWAPGEWRGH